MKRTLKILKYFFLCVFILLIGAIIIFWKSDLPLDLLKSKYASSESKFMQINGVNVHYRDQGVLSDSLPIVLIHGTGASLHTWQGWIDSLVSSKRVICLDLPAYGLTGANIEHDYSTSSYVNTVDTLLQKLNVTRCIIGGNSLGGNVSWNYAATYPQKVAKLILVDAAGYNFKSSSVPIAFKLARIPVLNNLIKFLTPRFLVEKSVKSVYSDPSKVTDQMISRYYDLTLRAGNREAFVQRIASPKNAIVVNNPSEIIRKIAAPTLILWGADDGLIPVASAYNFQTDLPNDSLVILPKLGHTPMEEDPIKTVKIVKAFLKIK